MKTAPFPKHETERLKKLYAYQVLDTPAEADFDDLIKLASEICGVPIALITLVDTGRQWFKARIGLSLLETTRDIAFCSHTILEDKLLEIQDTLADERFYDNPLVTGYPNIRFYAGVPLETPEGYKLGSLCVVDNQPRQLNDFQKSALTVLAKQVINQLEIRSKNQELKKLLEKITQYNTHLLQLGTHQSRMLSIVSHDLRNPINGLKGLLELFEQQSISPEETAALARMLEASLTTVEGLFNNLIAWATKDLEPNNGLLKPLELNKLAQSVIQLFDNDAARKDNLLVNETADVQVMADEDMLRFVLRNLVTNANKFTHQGTIRLMSQEKDNMVEISVADTGTGIEPEQLENLFDWEKRETQARHLR